MNHTPMVKSDVCQSDMQFETQHIKYAVYAKLVDFFTPVYIQFNNKTS